MKIKDIFEAVVAVKSTTPTRPVAPTQPVQPTTPNQQDAVKQKPASDQEIIDLEGRVLRAPNSAERKKVLADLAVKAPNSTIVKYFNKHGLIESDVGPYAMPKENDKIRLDWFDDGANDMIRYYPSVAAAIEGIKNHLVRLNSNSSPEDKEEFGLKDFDFSDFTKTKDKNKIVFTYNDPHYDNIYVISKFTGDTEPKEFNEARVPGLNYKEEVKSKKDPQLDRVILTLTAKDSEIMTKMAMKYKKLDNLQKMITEQRNAMNETVKQKMGEFFDAEDEFVTREIDTVSATMVLAKKGEGTAASVQTNVAWDQVAQEIMMLLDDELLPKAQLILANYTKVVRIPAQEPKSPALRVTPKESVGITEASVWDKLKTYGAKFSSFFKSWGAKYDAKLAVINKQLAQLGESIEEAAPGWGLTYTEEQCLDSIMSEIKQGLISGKLTLKNKDKEKIKQIIKDECEYYEVKKKDIIPYVKKDLEELKKKPHIDEATIPEITASPSFWTNLVKTAAHGVIVDQQFKNGFYFGLVRTRYSKNVDKINERLGNLLYKELLGVHINHGVSNDKISIDNALGFLGYDMHDEVDRTNLICIEVELKTKSTFPGFRESTDSDYEKRVKELEDEGLTTSDAQAVVDAELKKKKTVKEDWGSSDWFPVMKMMRQELGIPSDNPFAVLERSEEQVRQAAKDAAEAYYMQMGYDDVSWAARSIEAKFYNHMKYLMTQMESVTEGSRISVTTPEDFKKFRSFEIKKPGDRFWSTITKNQAAEMLNRDSDLGEISALEIAEIAANGEAVLTSGIHIRIR
jgi:hypothetical protein